LVVLPLFHAGGLFTGVLNALRGGATAVIRTFSVSRFWDDVRAYGCTQTVLMGAMIDFLWRAPASDSDNSHPLRNVTVVPAMPYVREFADRFGLSVESAYGQSETGTPIIASAQDAEPFLCGTPRSFFEVRIVDDYDVEVPTGAAGEILVRSNEPWSMFAGYLDDMAATIKATRNGWVHTGDMGRRNERGQIFFVDRKKDALRRRGENISSLEVEKYLLAHPDVAQAAIVSVPSEHLEDDIKALVVLEKAATFDPERLLRYLYEQLPYFMVPRYYEVIDELPLTPTGKVAKAELRKRGVTAGTWDCETHGFTVTRSALREEVRSS
jgi:crotonobetaine/carnitine-CoA ligase